MSRPARAALLLLALGAASWLAGNLRSLDLAEEATAVLAQAPGAAAPGAELDRAQRLLERAKRFGPDTPLVIRQGQASALLGRPEAGTRLFAEAARSEPSNFDAWRLLYAVTRKRDPGRAARARERALALDPQARIPAP